MASSDTKLQATIHSAAFAIPPDERYRTKNIATRLTEGEFAEVESAAAKAGKKLAGWLREAALTKARQPGSTTQIEWLFQAAPERKSDPLST